MPLYNAIPDKYREDLKEIAQIDIPFTKHEQSCKVYEMLFEGLTYYFIGNDFLFSREKELYGYEDDSERFAFFSLAILEMLKYIGFKPDVINVNDWHTSLVPVYRNVFYAQNEFYSDIKIVLTIHNIGFQKTCDFNDLNTVFELPDTAAAIVEYGGQINLVKGGIEAADAFTTVSPTYAEEIAGGHAEKNIADGVDYDFGNGLTPLIKERKWKLTGILNGLDDKNDPEKDPDIDMQYGIANYKAGKRENKRKLQERMELSIRPDVPLISIITRIDVRQKGVELIVDAINSGLFSDHDVQIAMLGDVAKGDEKGAILRDEFVKLAKGNEGKMSACIDFIPELSQKIYAASDIILVPSKYEPCGLTQLIAMKYGTIPVVRETGGLADTVTDNGAGQGNGFVFNEYSAEALRSAIDRALEGYKDPKGWDSLVKRAMAYDSSWDTNSAAEYIKLYKGL